MEGKWIGLTLAFLVGNVFMWFVLGQEYTAWSIRTRNKMHYFVLRWKGFLDRADRADEIAEDVVRWLRPLGLLAYNGFLVYLAIETYHMR